MRHPSPSDHHSPQLRRVTPTYPLGKFSEKVVANPRTASLREGQSSLPDSSSWDLRQLQGREQVCPVLTVRAGLNHPGQKGRKKGQHGNTHDRLFPAEKNPRGRYARLQAEGYTMGATRIICWGPPTGATGAPPPARKEEFFFVLVVAFLRGCGSGRATMQGRGGARGVGDAPWFTRGRGSGKARR